MHEKMLMYCIQNAPKACRFKSLLCIAILTTCVAQAQMDSLGYWISRPPMPVARQEIPVTAVGDQVFIPGGFASGTTTDIVEVYNAVTQIWSDFPSTPERLHHSTIEGDDLLIYLIGGYFENTFSPTNFLYRIDPNTDDWDIQSIMPDARAAHCSAYFDGKIYVFGGVISTGVTASTYSYDPIYDSWQELTPMPTAREHLACAIIDSLIYVVGGRDGQFINSHKLEAYSPASGLWYSLADMPTSRGGHAAASLNGRLYVMGGEFFTGGSGVYEENEEYNPLSNSWRAVAPMPTPRHGMGAATVADTIFVIGGAPTAGFGITDVNEGFVMQPNTYIGSEDHDLVEFSLEQNYPNPFNSSTIIRYNLSVRSNINLTIYDISGRKIRELVGEIGQQGAHEVRWDGTNDLGQQLASGVYYYRLLTNGAAIRHNLDMTFQRTRKMLLVR